MIHKFCDNHLTELYDAIKSGNILEIEKIEHELSPVEECVACAYALKAKGQAKSIIYEYLASQGFAVEVPKSSGILSGTRFWIVRIFLFLLIFFLLFLLLINFLPTIFSFILALSVSIFVFILFDQLLD